MTTTLSLRYIASSTSCVTRIMVTFSRSQIRNNQGRQQPQEHLAKRLPGAPGSVTPVESPGDLVEQQPGLILAQGEHAPQVRQVPLMFRQLVGPAKRDLHLRASLDLPVSRQSINRSLPLAP